MTLTLHKSQVTILVSYSDELAVHSCLLFSCRGRLRNWQADCFIVGLYCATI